ncbi:glycosyltransferase family 2 protein [Proteiniphilum sp. UBA5384]|uniref:glycosyltransferase family 2 protein n=1 Tax=Proteiniphilum sp. UBA5384 TaxID=1947279 RepID=UPI0025EA0CA9|nr:glycosyltransferase family 2 protein [Proteiniphilum sp. UBA5384]
MESPLVSIIIPVYNSEKYVEESIRSALHQTYRNIEIIIVNDGSTDNSPQIIENLQRQDNRIICISKSNQGLPLARKTGIEKASGKYIQHLDADDTLINDAIERLVDRAEETNADIVSAPFFFCYPDKEPILSANIPFIEFTGIAYYRAILDEKAYWSVWSNFQKRSLFQHPIETVADISLGEDAILMTQLIFYANKIVSEAAPILNYNRYENSMTYKISHSQYTQFRACRDWIKNYLEKIGLKQTLKKELTKMHLQSTFDGISWEYFDHTRQDMRKLEKSFALYPDLKSTLTRRQRKIFASYKISPVLGYLRLKYYQWKKKL